MPQDKSRSKIDPRYYRPDPIPEQLTKAERVARASRMTTTLPEQAELDEFYAGKRARLSVAVLDRLFDSAPDPSASIRRPKMQRQWGEWQKMAAKRG